MSLNALMYTARDALSAQSYGLNVTGQNISNANTPGYVRRDPILVTRALGTMDYGGVKVEGLRRAADQFTERRYLEAVGLSAAAGEHDTQLSRLESLFNDGVGSGLGTAFDQLFGAFSDLTSNPADPASRMAVLSRAEELAARFRNTGDAIATQRAELLTSAKETTTQINELAWKLAELNRKISVAKGAGSDAADLEDEQAQSLNKLSGLIDVHTFPDSKGGLVVQVAGTTLVEGAEVQKLTIDVDPSGNMQLLAARGSGPGSDITKHLNAGKLAGIRDARDVDLVQVQNKLDQLAFDFATAVNSQHAAGFGKDGVSGRNLFSVSATVAGAARSLGLDPAVQGNPDAIAAASSAATLPGGSGNSLLLQGLGTQTIASGGTRSPSEAYSDLVGDVGTRRASSASDLGVRTAMQDQVYAMKESASGVSLDEEMVNLTRYQRAYEAATKVISTVDQMLEELIGRLGR